MSEQKFFCSLIFKRALFFFNHSSLESNHAIYCSSLMGSRENHHSHRIWTRVCHLVIPDQHILPGPAAFGLTTHRSRPMLPSIADLSSRKRNSKNFLLTFFTLCRVNMMHILLPAASGTGLACRLTNKECLLTLQRLVFDGNIWTDMLALPEKVFYSNTCLSKHCCSCVRSRDRNFYVILLSEKIYGFLFIVGGRVQNLKHFIVYQLYRID